MSTIHSLSPIGYTQTEFRQIMQIYAKGVYSGLFRDFSFSEYQGRYFISFREQAQTTPLITIEKRRLGPDKALFVATRSGGKGQPVECVRSEKIDLFIQRLKEEVGELMALRPRLGFKVVS